MAGNIPEDFKGKKYQKMGRNAVFSSSRSLIRTKLRRVGTAGAENWGTEYAPPDSIPMGFGWAHGGSRLNPIIRGKFFGKGIAVNRKPLYINKYGGNDYTMFKRLTELSR
jgi:hypothetical protein